MDFNQDFYITEIHKIESRLPHVRTHMNREALKRRSYLQDVSCHLDYAEHIVYRFVHHIQYG